MGMDTAQDALYYNPDINAGFEYLKDLRTQWSPQVVKDPRLALKLPDLVESGVDISLVFVLIRDLESATRSRVENDILWVPPAAQPVVGGEIEIEDPYMRQLVFNQRLLATLFVDLTILGIPFLPIHFPRCAEDFDYLYAKLCAAPLYDQNGDHILHGRAAWFRDVFYSVFDSNLIHHRKE